MICSCMRIQAGVLAHRDKVATYLDKKTDVSGAYPHGEICYNISRETTKLELVAVEGVDADIAKMESINLLSGQVNAVEYCVEMLGYPKLHELKSIYLAEKVVV